MNELQHSNNMYEYGKYLKDNKQGRKLILG